MALVMVCPALLTLMGPLSAALETAVPVQLIAEPICEIDRSDWLFGFAKKCIRKESRGSDKSKQPSQEDTHSKLLSFFIYTQHANIFTSM